MSHISLHSGWELLTWGKGKKRASSFAYRLSFSLSSSWAAPVGPSWEVQGAETKQEARELLESKEAPKCRQGQKTSPFEQRVVRSCPQLCHCPSEKCICGDTFGLGLFWSFPFKGKGHSCLGTQLAQRWLEGCWTAWGLDKKSSSAFCHSTLLLLGSGSSCPQVLPFLP